MVKKIQAVNRNGRPIEYISHGDSVLDGKNYPILTDGYEQFDLSIIGYTYGIIENGVWSAVSSDNYTHKIVRVSPGDVIKIKGNSSHTSKYALLNTYSTPVASATPDFCSGTSLVSVPSNVEAVFTVPLDGNYLYVQEKSGGTNILPVVWKKIGGRGIINKLAFKPIDNDLKTQKDYLPDGTTIELNGATSEDNYGISGAKYTIPVENEDIIHLFFKFRFDGKLPIIDDSTIVSYGGVKASLYSRIPVEELNVRPQIFLCLHNDRVGAYSQFMTEDKFRPFCGDTAFSVKFTGDISDSANQDIVMVMSDNSVVIKHNGGANIHTIPVTAETTISELVDALNVFPDIECVGYSCEGKTYSDLLYSPLSTLRLVQSLTYTSGTSYYDNSPIYIPLAIDNKIHSVEIIIDYTKVIENERVGVSYFALDGYTISQKILDKPTNNNIVIGSSVFPMDLFDLHIGYGYEDAEIITNTNPGYASSIQMISNNNPRLIIWEGHGVDAEKETDTPISDEMAVTTDRLYTVFNILQRHGYVPVTWEDIIEWKLNGKQLPKRCYNIMMDDFRLENFMQYAKRIPFNKHNVKAGLAVIEDYDSVTDTVTIDGKNYTVKECYDACQRNGWYLSSHAKHTNLGNTQSSLIPDILKDLSDTCNKIGIHSDVIIYPYGSYKNVIPHLENSAFKIGVMITSEKYNCAASSDFFLTRYEIGRRASLESVLSAIL